MMPRRMNRNDWLGVNNPPPDLAKLAKRPKTREKERRTPKKPVKWTYRLGEDVTTVVVAMSKSEARAALKAALGLRRLPPGAVIVRVAA